MLRYKSSTFRPNPLFEIFEQACRNTEMGSLIGNFDWGCSTVWMISNFPTTPILREINVSWFLKSKTAILTFEGFEVWFLEKNYQKFKIQSSKNGEKALFEPSKWPKVISLKIWVVKSWNFHTVITFLPVIFYVKSEVWKLHELTLTLLLTKSSRNQRFYLIFHTVCTWCYELTQFLPLFFHFFLQDPKLYVSTILDVHRKYNALVMTAFNNDSGFVASLDKACGKFINNNSVTKRANASSKSPELLAKYCDLLLKKSSRNPEEAELEDTLNQVVSTVIQKLCISDPQGRSQIVFEINKLFTFSDVCLPK